MKYCIVALFFVCAVSAAPSIEDEDIQAAQFGMNRFNYPYNSHIPYYYQQGMYRQNSMDFSADQQEGALNPGKYMNMKDEDFPVDYSLQCSNTCGCRQTCTMIWWQPCTCRCPPPCGCNGCIWGCCGNKCCNQESTTTTTESTTVSTTESTTLPTTESTTIYIPNPDEPSTDGPCNGGNCCNRCSCMPCMMPIFWMCPPRCGSGCCGGSSNCCNGSNNSCCNNSSNCCNSSNTSCCGK